MDFTIKKYSELLNVMISNGYNIQSYKDYILAPKEKSIIIRHDIDKKPEKALIIAKLESSLNINGSYYFRSVKESWNEEIILKIESLGHEIGYHYENLTTCNGDISKALADFKNNLYRLRKIATVETICMHGSPMSKYDSKDLWKYENYRNFGIIGEPYFDIDFSNIFYITDTGRMWDGYKYSVRDKIDDFQSIWDSKGLTFHSTDEIINSIKKNIFPKQAMISMHPQRWDDRIIPWTFELISQSIKNKIKRYYINGK